VFLGFVGRLALLIQRLLAVLTEHRGFNGIAGGFLQPVVKAAHHTGLARILQSANANLKPVHRVVQVVLERTPGQVSSYLRLLVACILGLDVDAVDRGKERLHASGFGLADS